MGEFFHVLLKQEKKIHEQEKKKKWAMDTEKHRASYPLKLLQNFQNFSILPKISCKN